MKAGISYYRHLAGMSDQDKIQFNKDLNYAEVAMDCLNYKYAITSN